MISKKLQAELVLIFATLFWGWTFPVVKEAIETIPVFTFLAIRFALSGFGMAIITRRLPSIESLKFGGAVGFVLFLVFAFQTWGLLYTSAINSGFISGMNVLWLMLAKPSSLRYALIPVVSSLLGLWLLTSPEVELNLGDALSVICSLFIALHIIMLSRKRENQSSADLAASQFWTVAAACGLCAIITGEYENVSLADFSQLEVISALLITVLGATIFAFWAQTHFQRRTTPMQAGLIYIFEPVFALIFAVSFYGEDLSQQVWIGAAVMFGAMVISIRRSI